MIGRTDSDIDGGRKGGAIPFASLRVDQAAYVALCYNRGLVLQRVGPLRIPIGGRKGRDDSRPGRVMKELVLTYPDDLAQAVRLTGEELSAQLRLMAALKMFELGKLSSGKAAELAGLSRGEFFEACGRYRVSLFNYPDEELEAELRADLQAAGGGANR